ncbi:AAA family ATPase [Clostridium sp. A1-XYC3]|uniref:Nuclease SbcCD subunit C n=1 Tax=Clostridium tanneri TaxID=3037988 RepID=A0ABU4JWI4_9CLOT|nr:AAA family ATPase [Clostridium sp. A1-XYC3]MDW8802467.1 AAA family ATPase [Clostridium sp. A1-XYC3]
MLEEINIENFRQYYDKQAIKVSKDKEKNVTVIHGENGEGKTAFLNLIKWCLYKKCYLPEAERLLNERTEAELEDGGYAGVSVEIKFEDRGQKYVVKRSVKYKKQSQKTNIVGEDFTVVSINELGEITEYKNPQNTISQVLPEKMESYFFFDGEKIDNLTKLESTKDIKNAIKNIMGIEVIENAVTDLGKAANILRKEFGKYSNNKEVIKLNDNLEAYESQLSTLKLKKKQLETNKKCLLIEKESIDEKLRKLDGARELQEKRDALENRKVDIQKRIKELNMNLRKVYSSKGYLAFNNSLIEKVKIILEDRRKKGEIPAGIKEQFVDDLLERKTCICGRMLEHNTNEYNCVKSWKKKSGNNELENAFIKISADVRLIENERESLFENLQRLKKYKSELTKQMKEIQEELDEISAELDDKESEDIQALEEKRKSIEINYEDTLTETGSINTRISDCEKRINDFRNKIKAAETEEQKSTIAKERFNNAEAARDALFDILEITIENVRVNLQERIDKVYDSFSKKGYKAILNENFELQIIKTSDPLKRPVPMSQGERQITSLCFIGALVDIARERSKVDTDFFRGGIYPIVMDSPFGALDPEHKKRVAEGMPKLSQQVIILVTNSQWKGEVQESMLSKVGKSYNLINYNPKKDPSIKYEYTIIKEG